MKPTIAIDMQALQGQSTDLSVARYVEHLSLRLLTDYSNQFDFRLVLSQNAPVPPKLSLQPWKSVPKYFIPIPPVSWRSDIASSFSDSYQDLPIAADVALVASPFEGFLDSRTAAPRQAVTWARHTVPLVYDLSPLSLPEIYLTEPAYRAWYSSQLSLLAEAHHILVTSNTTKLELQELLHIPRTNVSNISAATWDTFDPNQVAKSDIHERLGITKPYFVYTCHHNQRQRSETLIEAFGQLPLRLRELCQLVLVSEQKQLLADKQWSIHAAGIPDDALVVTGFVDEESLLSLYVGSIAAVFSSPYQGFGLPVLEAIRTGTLVLAEDSTSVPDVLGTPAGLFDPTDRAQLAGLMTRAATDPGWRDQIRERQAEHCSTFSWSRTAALACKALRDLTAPTQSAPAVRAKLVAITGPLPPTESGVATHASNLLKALRQRYHLQVILREGTTINDVFAEQNVDIRYSNEPLPLTPRYIHHVGNQPIYHGYQLHLIARTGGIVVLHDVFLDGLADYLPKISTPTSLDQYIELTPSATTVTDFERARTFRQQRIAAILTWLAHNANQLVVHSEHAAATLKELAPHVTKQPIIIPLAQEAHPDALAKHSNRPLHRPLRVVCPGFVNESKSPFTVIRALALLKRELPAEVTFLGDADPRLAQLLYDTSVKSGIPITITGYVTDIEYQSLLSAADLCLVLRSFDRAETSAAALNALSLGIPTIVNDIGSFRELPSSVVIKVPPNNHSALSIAIATLASDSNACIQMGSTSVAYITVSHSWEVAVDAYTELLRSL